ncbi:MAG: PDZ domain-containing protein [Rhodomicrobium sp.]
MRRIAVFLFWLALGCGAAGAEEQAKGFLGAQLADVTQEEAAKLGWEAPRGARVVKPVEGSPAAAAGLQPGDIVVTLNGVEIENAAGFDAAIGGKAPGAAVKLRLLRAGKEKTVSVTLAARPAEPKIAADGPLPMLDTGGHMATIRGIAFTPDGRQLVSASEDKTIRVWDLASGKTVRTIRGESTPGPAGKVYAMALSPDGKWLAAGGWLPGTREESDAIRLYEFASGKLVAPLKGHRNVVNRLAFSSDGSRLISGSSDCTAILWDTGIRAGARGTEPKLLHRLEGHKDDIYAVGFSPDGSRAVTGSLDHDLRLWRVDDGKEIAHMTGHGDKVRSLAVAPDGTIASGDVSGEIRLWDRRDGRFLRVLARQGMMVGSLSFSPDGKLLLSSCGQHCNGVYGGKVYDVASGKEIVTYIGHDNVVIATAFSPDGRWVATGGGDGFPIHLWDPHSGKPRPGPDGKPVRLAGQGQPVWAAGFSADGRRIGWGNLFGYKGHNERGPLEQALTLPLGEGALGAPVALGEAEAGAFRRAQASFGGFSLGHRKGGAYGVDAILDILKDGRAVASITRDATSGYDHRSYSFTPDGKTVVSGGMNGVLTAYGRAGNELGEFVSHEGDIWAVAPSPDGRFLVSGSADQTVRLWNLKTRELLVTLFRGADGEWVMWTPQGYYAASGPGSELIGWQINHGPEHEAEYVTAAQLRKTLNRPDIVARAIQLASAEQAVKEAYGTNFKLSDLLAKPVPRLRIVSPAPNTALRGGSASLEIALEATPDPVKAIRIQVNGRQVAEHQPDKGGGFTPGALTFTVPLAKGRNTIRVVAVNETGETPAEVAVTHDGDGALDKRGVLYILAIGVDKYPHLGKACVALDGKTPRDCDLTVAGADAKAFAETMAARLGPLHESVESRVLVNGASPLDTPTAAHVLDALGALSHSQPNDTIVLFVSGHGFNEGQNYRFLPTDAAFSEGALRRSTVVPWVVFQETVEAANGRRILFLDTCHSGNSYNQRLSNDSYAANIIVYSAARWDQEALERGDLGHGLFTYAVVEGVNGAAKNPAGEVKTESLRDFLSKRVPEMAKALKREQEPQYFRGRDAQDYLLAAGK